MFSTLLCYCKCFKENGLWALKQSWRMDPKAELVPRVNSLGEMSNFFPLSHFIAHGSEGSAVPKIEEVI